MGPHAEDLPGFNWMNSPKLKQSSDKEWRDYYENKSRQYFREVELLKATNQGLARRVQQLENIVEQVDDELIVNWIPVKDNNYRKALHDLICFNIEIANNPQVSLEAKHRQDEISDLWTQIEFLKNKLENKEYESFLSKVPNMRKINAGA